MDKKPRAIVMADNWKTKEIKLVLAIRDEMVDFSIDPNLIQEYLDEEYERINMMYDEKIKKYFSYNFIMQVDIFQVLYIYWQYDYKSL